MKIRFYEFTIRCSIVRAAQSWFFYITFWNFFGPSGIEYKLINFSNRELIFGRRVIGKFTLLAQKSTIPFPILHGVIIRITSKNKSISENDSKCCTRIHCNCDLIQIEPIHLCLAKCWAVHHNTQNKKSMQRISTHKKLAYVTIYFDKI